MMGRSPEIAAFVGASAAALRAACQGDALRAAETVLGRLADEGAPGAPPSRLPACEWVGPALADVPAERAALGRALAAIEGRLQWYRRATARPEDGAFWDGHANAMILGPRGLEVREDVMVGATVMAPNLRYPDHNHPPEEVYLALTPGTWWNAEMDWTDPGPSGSIYNPPGIAHAMRSGPEPFLALWYLPL
jgi:hypothetical protein